MPLVIGEEEKALAFTPEFGALVDKFGPRKRTHWKKNQIQELVSWFDSVGGPYPEDRSRGNIKHTFEDPNARLEQKCIDRYIAMRAHRLVSTMSAAQRPTKEGPPKYIWEPPAVLMAGSA